MRLLWLNVLYMARYMVPKHLMRPSQPVQPRHWNPPAEPVSTWSSPDYGGSSWGREWRCKHNNVALGMIVTRISDLLLCAQNEYKMIVIWLWCLHSRGLMILLMNNSVSRRLMNHIITQEYITGVDYIILNDWLFIWLTSDPQHALNITSQIES